MRSSEFQSTRPRGARPHQAAHSTAWRVVSIHAPARGATVAGATAEDLLKVSIHAPARGATISPDTPQPAAKFQSTRPRGARRFRHDAHCLRERVSIHAPARGATLCGCVASAFKIGFNPRAREGRDFVLQSVRMFHDGFNPRAREGRDDCLLT